jgi:hypothetical protein
MCEEALKTKRRNLILDQNLDQSHMKAMKIDWAAKTWMCLESYPIRIIGSMATAVVWLLLKWPRLSRWNISCRRQIIGSWMFTRNETLGTFGPCRQPQKSNFLLNLYYLHRDMLLCMWYSRWGEDSASKDFPIRRLHNGCSSRHLLVTNWNGAETTMSTWMLMYG